MATLPSDRRCPQQARSTAHGAGGSGPPRPQAPRGGRRLPWARRAAPALLLPLLASSVALAQGPSSGQDLADLALLWASGEYAEPVICPLAEGPVRGVRTLVIRPDRRVRHRTADLVQIQPLELPDGVQGECTNDLGAREPELEGRLRIGLSGHRRPDMAQRDFQQALRREGGFDFEILAGRLNVRGGEGEERAVDLEGGTARLEIARPGSDAARILSGAGDGPKRILTLEAPGGDRFVFHLMLLRPPR